MCHTVLGVARGNLPAPEQSWETHSFTMWFLCAALCREQVFLYSKGLLRRKKVLHSRRYLISPPIFSLFVIKGNHSNC